MTVMLKDLAFDEMFAAVAVSDAPVDLLGNCLRQPMSVPIVRLNSLVGSPVSLKSSVLKYLQFIGNALSFFIKLV